MVVVGDAVGDGDADVRRSDGDGGVRKGVVVRRREEGREEKGEERVVVGVGVMRSALRLVRSVVSMAGGCTSVL